MGQYSPTVRLTYAPSTGAAIANALVAGIDSYRNTRDRTEAAADRERQRRIQDAQLRMQGISLDEPPMEETVVEPGSSGRTDEPIFAGKDPGWTPGTITVPEVPRIVGKQAPDEAGNEYPVLAPQTQGWQSLPNPAGGVAAGLSPDQPRPELKTPAGAFDPQTGKFAAMNQYQVPAPATQPIAAGRDAVTEMQPATGWEQLGEGGPWLNEEQYMRMQQPWRQQYEYIRNEYGEPAAQNWLLGQNEAAQVQIFERLAESFGEEAAADMLWGRQGGQSPASIQVYDRLIAEGVPVDEAREIAFGGLGGGMQVQRPTEAMFKGYDYYISAVDSHLALEGLSPDTYPSVADIIKYENLPFGLGKLWADDETRQFFASVRPFIVAALRKESGAAITPAEWEEAAYRFLPQPGDDAMTLARKKRNRENVLRGMELTYDAVSDWAGASGYDVPQVSYREQSAPQAGSQQEQQYFDWVGSLGSMEEIDRAEGLYAEFVQKGLSHEEAMRAVMRSMGASNAQFGGGG